MEQENVWICAAALGLIEAGVLHTPYQYTTAELKAAVDEQTRLGVGVHATGEPGTFYAAQAGVASIDHADQLSDATMALITPAT